MKLQSLMEKGDGKMVKCPECGAFGNESIQKKGFRENKRQKLQKYYCKKCDRHFVIKKMLQKSYPTNVILNAISFYNKGMTFADASKKVNMKFCIKTSPRLINTWMKEFSDICTFRRFRNKIREERSGKKSGFSNPVFSYLIEHKQPYLFKYHRLKIDMLLTYYFQGLKNYLLNVVEICPHELFLKDNVRSSQIKINYANSKLIGIEKKNNYACKLAGLALKMARANKERHEIIQDFMLVNDAATLAVEVPIWLTSEEVNKLNSEFNVFPEILGHDENKKDDGKDCGKNDGKSNDEEEITGGEITGHIDIIQARFGLIYVLDYKPEAEKVDAASQLFTYALALSTRTDIWLRNFRCAWFDEKAYYEFNPNDVILACISEKLGADKKDADKKSGVDEIPEEYLKKYVLNEKSRRYFTSLKFQEKRKQETAEEQELKEKWNKEEAEKLEKETAKKEKEKTEKGIRGKEKIEIEGIVIMKDKYGKIVGARK